MIRPEIAAKAPHYAMVPRTLAANLEARAAMLRLCSQDQGARAAMKRMCSEDILFFVSMFVWTLDPRHPVSKKLPFLPYEFQEETLLDLLACIDHRDALIEKSRDMGASWMVLIVFAYCWLFRANNTFLLLSRNEYEVDKFGDEDTLFAKIDFIVNNLPSWMLPQHRRVKLGMRNHENGSTIDGRSTTSDSARGGRRTAIFLDEFASVPEGYEVLKSTADVTRSRFFISTPKGAGNAFFHLAKNTTIHKVRLHWSRHPVKSRGLYVDDRGKTRSEWYDAECERRGNVQQEIAQELDIDYLGSDYAFFDGEWLDDMLKRTRMPDRVCRFDYDAYSAQPLAVTPMNYPSNTEGLLLLWGAMDHEGRMPSDRHYYLGVDVAMGTGSSNSVIYAVDEYGTQVAEISTTYTKPDDLADVAVSLARWLLGPGETPAWLTWESNGPGRVFGDRVVDDHRYARVHYRRNEQKIGKPIRDIPGHHSTRENKVVTFSDVRRAMGAGDLTCLSRETIEECRYIVHSPSTGELRHSKSETGNDPTGARDNHGDRATAMAMCWIGLQSRKQRVSAEHSERDAPIGSFAWRREQRRQAAMDEDWKTTEPDWADAGAAAW